MEYLVKIILENFGPFTIERFMTRDEAENFIATKCITTRNKFIIVEREI